MNSSRSNFDASDQTITVAWTKPDMGVSTEYNVTLSNGNSVIASTNTAELSTDLSGEMLNGYTYNLEIISRSEAFSSSQYVYSDAFSSTIRTDVQGNFTV